MKTPKRIFSPEFDLMGLIFVVWLCTLPFIGLLVVPFFGMKAAVIVGALLLIAMLIYCWGSCIPKVIQLYKERLTEREPE